MSEPCESSDSLARRLDQGDEQSLAELFALHRERLWRIVEFRLPARLKGRVDPDDVLQDAYLAASQRIAHYDAASGGSPFVWLRMILNQTLVDLHRHHLGAQMRDAGREVAIEGCHYPQATSISLAVQLVGSMTSPSQAAVRDEMLDRVQQAIDGMNDLDREVLALRHFEELNNAETAEVLGIQPKAASIRYVRALKRLQEILSDVTSPLRKDGHV